MTLPPGQRAIDGFPRFGTHLHRPPPRIPTDPVIQIRGAVIEPFDVPLADLAMLPRRELAADFHCVAGWSTTNLRWEGVAFGTLYDLVLKPKLQPDKTITHVVFGGLDGFESSLLIEDALRSDVVLADVLDGRPLDPDHGTPLRLVSPSQYGYMSTKHLCAIELCTSAPTRELGAATAVARRGLRGPLILRHPRARVWEEERHPYLPAPLLRPFYRLFIKPGIERARTSPSRSSRPMTPGGGEFTTALDIRPRHCDAQGMVHAIGYYTFFEEAFLRWLDRCGTPYSGLRDAGLDLVIGESSCRHHGPACLDDELVITVGAGAATRSSTTVALEATVDGRPIASGSVTYVTVRRGESYALPPDLRRRLGLGAVAVEVPSGLPAVISPADRTCCPKRSARSGPGLLRSRGVVEIAMPTCTYPGCFEHGSKKTELGGKVAAVCPEHWKPQYMKVLFPPKPKRTCRRAA